jgi:TonB family protein
MLRLFIGTSALIHFVLILTLPVELFVSPTRSTESLTGNELSEMTILRVMEIASASLIVSEYSFDVSDKPSLPPEEDIEPAVELADVPPLVAPARPAPVARESRGKRQGEVTSTVPGRYSAPVPVIMMWPDYPSSARRRGVRGTVVVRVHVTAEGKVDKAEVVSGLENRACRKAALEAAMKLRFLPAVLDGEPVDAWFSYPVEFGKKR